MSTTQPPTSIYTPMATTISSSYGIVIPDLRHFIIVNAQPGADLDELIIIDSSPTHVIRNYNNLLSMLFDNGSPAYTTLRMEFTMNITHGSPATARFLNDDDQDHEALMAIARFIIQHRALYANGGVSEEKILKRPIEIAGNGKEEEENEICAICLKEYEADEMMGRLKCRHGYHAICIFKWLLRNRVCPICRASVNWL